MAEKADRLVDTGITAEKQIHIRPRLKIYSGPASLHFFYIYGEIMKSKNIVLKVDNQSFQETRYLNKIIGTSIIKGASFIFSCFVEGD